MAQCVAPFTKRHERTGENQHFPCGKCFFCLRRRVSGWSFRLVKEYERAVNGYFITFTYDTDHVPITNNGFMSLCKRDFQLFAKRYRKQHSKLYKYPFKYFAVGEYGGKSSRPHYHAIVYNVDLLLIEKSWQVGAIHVGELNEASCGYTLKYMMKASTVPLHKNDDRAREFQLMSKGLGSNYLTPQMIDWHKADLLNRYYTPLKDGKKVALPRYLKDKIYTEHEREFIGKNIVIENQELTGQQELNLWESLEIKRKKQRLQEHF